MAKSRKYCRLYADVAEDRKANELAEGNPLAEVLRLWSLSRCDVYGIIDGSPRLYKSRVCPALDITLRRLGQIIDVLVSLGFYCRYEVGGEVYLWIAKYHEYQEVKWDRVGPPQKPLPDCWVGTDHHEVLSFAQLQERYGTSPGPVPEQSGTTPPFPKDQRTKGPKDQEKEDPAPPVGDAAPASPAEEPPAPKPPRQLTPIQQVIEEAWAAHEIGSMPKGQLKGYSGLTEAVTKHGIPAVQLWVRHVEAHPVPVPPGANAWTWFCGRFRAALERPWEWDPVRQKPPRENRGVRPAHKGPPPKTNEWGEIID